MAEEAKNPKKKAEKKADKKPDKKKKDRLAWFREMNSELKKIVWPSRQMVVKNTGTVLLCSFLIGLCIWIFDFAATNVVSMILSVFGS